MDKITHVTKQHFLGMKPVVDELMETHQTNQPDICQVVLNQIAFNVFGFALSNVMQKAELNASAG